MSPTADRGEDRELAHSLEVGGNPVDGRRAVFAEAHLRIFSICAHVRVFSTCRFRQPRSPCEPDTELRVPERRGRVGVRRHRYGNPGVAGQPRVRVAHVQPVWLRVDLQGGPRLCGTRDDPLDIHLGARSLQDPPARQVADAVDVRVVERAEDALGGAALERGMHRRDDPVELRQHVVVDVERAVGTNVHLDPAQNPERLHALVHGLDLLPLGLHASVAQVVGVVGQAEEFVAATLRLERHLLDRVLPVGRPGRVAVHLATEVGELDQLGKLSRASGSDLAVVLAQLGRDEGVAEIVVELFLRRMRDDLAGLDHA